MIRQIWWQWHLGFLLLVCPDIVFTLQRFSLRHHRDHELIYAQDWVFSVVRTFLFLMQLYSFFFHSLSVDKGEMEGYMKLIAEEIAVKRSLHFFFLHDFFFFFFFPYYQCYWPLVGIWIFKRHFISLYCSFSQGKGGKSYTVFLFYPPRVWTCKWTQVKLSYFLLMSPSLVLHTSFALCLKLLQQTEKLKDAAESVENIFSRFLLVSVNQ